MLSLERLREIVIGLCCSGNWGHACDVTQFWLECKGFPHCNAVEFATILACS